jgi:hypothetical protein
MKPRNAIETWDAVSKKVYWDRDVALDKWREMVHTGHRSYLPDAIATMDVTEFVHFYGATRFVQDWPTLRSALSGPVALRAGTYDLAWSRLSGGGWNLRPVKDFHDMPKMRKQFMVQVALSPGKSIYELAKSLGIQYRRAHEHAQTLIKEGKLRDQATVENGHRKRNLFPSYAPL